MLGEQRIKRLVWDSVCFDRRECPGWKPYGVALGSHLRLFPSVTDADLAAFLLPVVQVGVQVVSSSTLESDGELVVPLGAGELVLSRADDPGYLAALVEASLFNLDRHDRDYAKLVRTMLAPTADLLHDFRFYSMTSNFMPFLKLPRRTLEACLAARRGELIYLRLLLVVELSRTR